MHTYQHADQEGEKEEWQRLGRAVTLCFVCVSRIPYESTGKSPFFVMYGRNPVLPTTAMLTNMTHPDGRTEVDCDNYALEMIACIASVWQAARDHIQIAQSKRKWNYDKSKKGK